MKLIRMPAALAMRNITSLRATAVSKTTNKDIKPLSSRELRQLEAITKLISIIKANSAFKI